MAGKREQEPKAVGQRSISAMFSDSPTPFGRSGSGRPLPLIEFLNRKCQKRTSIQGCVVDAGLTLKTRERLQTSGHPKTSKAAGIGIGEKVTSRHRDSNGESSASSSNGEAPSETNANEAVQTPPPRLEIFSNPGNFQDLDGHRLERASQNYQSRSGVEFIDMTGDDDDEREKNLEDRDHVQLEYSEICRKRRRSQAEGPFEKSTGLLILGDEPKCRRQPNFQSQSNKKSSDSATFNHYADGAGWWDESGVGVEGVGSASVWEGVGSMSFGGIL